MLRHVELSLRLDQRLGTCDPRTAYTNVTLCGHLPLIIPPVTADTYLRRRGLTHSPTGEQHPHAPSTSIHN